MVQAGKGAGMAAKKGTAHARARAQAGSGGTGRFTDDYLPYLLAQASARACAAFADALKAEKLVNLSWRILATLHDEGSLSVGALSRIVLGQQPRVTQVVNALARQGLVSRGPGADDRRVTLVTITARGRRRIVAVFATARAREGFAQDRLGPADLAMLKRLLRRLVAEPAQPPSPVAPKP